MKSSEWFFPKCTTIHTTVLLGIVQWLSLALGWSLNPLEGLHTFTEQLLIECLLCSRHCCKHWGYSNEEKRQNSWSIWNLASPAGLYCLCPGGTAIHGGSHSWRFFLLLFSLSWLLTPSGCLSQLGGQGGRWERICENTQLFKLAFFLSYQTIPRFSVFSILWPPFNLFPW